MAGDSEELQLLPPDENRSQNNNNNTLVRKHIGLFSASLMIVGHIIGSGIFITPKGVLQYSGSVGMALVIWCICGLISLIGSQIYLELGTCIPKSGGNYIYLKTAYGELAAFLFLWIFVVVQIPSNLAIAALTFSHYVLEPLFQSCNMPDHVTHLIAVLVLTFITFINCYNVHWATRIQNVFAITKVLALLIIVITGMAKLIFGNTQNFHNAFQGTTTDPGYLILAFYSGLFTYSGWNALNSITEEVKDPCRIMPMAAYIAISLTTVVYVLTNIAYLSVLSPAEIKSSNAVAVTFGDHALGIMTWIMPLCVAISTFGSLNGNIFASARIIFVAASEGHLPSFLSMVNVNYLTPTLSLIFMCSFGLMYLSVSHIYVLITYTSFTDALIFALVSFGLIRLRYTEPLMDRPIKVNIFFPVVYFILTVCLTVIPCYVTPRETSIGLAVTLSGIPVYYLLVFPKKKPQLVHQFISKMTYLAQVLTVSIPEDKGD